MFSNVSIKKEKKKKEKSALKFLLGYLHVTRGTALQLQLFHLEYGVSESFTQKDQ